VITVLIVSTDRPDLDALASHHPSVEILRARDLEEALEKLGRNRRIDAVLLLGQQEPARIAEAIFEENPAAPPIYLPGSEPAVPPIKTLDASDPAKLLELIARELSGQ